MSATLITGGSGFVGMAVAEAEAARGRDVVLFARDLPPASWLAALGSGVRVAIGDVQSSVDLEAAFAASPIDRVVHAAAVTAGAEREREDPVIVAAVNLGGTCALMKAAERHRPRRLVALSSVAVYGFADPGPTGRYLENACPEPAALYGITKLAGEHAARRLGAVYGLDVCSVRLGPVYGPWERPTKVRDAMSPHLQVMICAAEGRPVVLPRACAADWIYSRDAAAGILTVLHAPDRRSWIYNLGGGVVSDLPGFCTALGLPWSMASSDRAATVRYGLPRDRAPMETGRITTDLGFRPAFSVEQAAADYRAWFDRFWPAA